MQWQRDTINNLIEEAIMEADQKGVKVLSLGLLNQASKTIQNQIMPQITIIHKCNVVAGKAGE